VGRTPDVLGLENLDTDLVPPEAPPLWYAGPRGVVKVEALYQP
jgi:hypothetical protein